MGGSGTWVAPLRSILKRLMFQQPVESALSIACVMMSLRTCCTASNGVVRLALDSVLRASISRSPFIFLNRSSNSSDSCPPARTHAPVAQAAQGHPRKTNSHSTHSTRTGELEALVAVVVAVVDVAGVDHSTQHAPQHERKVHDLWPRVVVLRRHVADDELRQHLEGLVGGVPHDAAHLGRAHLLLAARLHEEDEGVALRVHLVLHGVVEGGEKQLREALALADQLAQLLQAPTHTSSIGRGDGRYKELPTALAGTAASGCRADRTAYTQPCTTRRWR